MTSRDNEILFLSAIDALRNITVVSTNLRKDLKQNILESIENLIKVHNNVNNELDAQKSNLYQQTGSRYINTRT